MSKLSRYLKKCNEVYHTTLNPNEFGVVRIHLVPPKKPKPYIPWVTIINGYSIIPLQSGWAVLLKEFMENLNKQNGKPLSDDAIKDVVNKTIVSLKKIFPRTKPEVFKSDLNDMVETFKSLAIGNEPKSDIGYMTLSEYAKYMKAPHRMDLMVSAMEKNGCWNCNQKCIHCYAAHESMSNKEELNTLQWKKVIDNCRKACIPALTFTGGEATLRDDLVELIDYSKWFVTRLNTNGILLSSELCESLYKASLDSVQVTLYSYDEKIHNQLVGGTHFNQTIQGIKNAIKAGLDVSINTPLCSINIDYVKTMEFAMKLGVRYFSCSGLIPTGNAKTEDSLITKLTQEEITNCLSEAIDFAKDNKLEVSFTSPGWVSENFLRKHKMVVPSCGACLSNMAVAPNGDVIPCQSWLNGTILGSMLDSNFSKIWENEKTEKIRKKACKIKQTCLLRGDV